MTIDKVKLDDEISINELHVDFFKKILGFKPGTGSIKPVHFINNISREILGYYYQNKDLYNFIEPRGKDKNLDPEREFDKLCQLPFYENIHSKKEFQTLRRRAKGLLNSDGAVMANNPSKPMISFTAANELFIEKDTMGSFIQNYHKSLFAIDLGEEKNISELLKKNLLSNNDNLEKLDPITILFYPLLSQEKKYYNEESIDSDFLNNDFNKLYIEKYIYLAKNFYNNYSSFLETNRIKLFQKICHFSCILPLIQFNFLNTSSPSTLILSASKEGQVVKIDTASHESYENLYSNVKNVMCTFLSNKLGGDHDFVERINSIKFDDENEMNNFLKSFKFSNVPKKNEKIGKNYLENRKLVFDQFFLPEDRLNSFSQTLHGIYENEVSKSYQFKAFMDKLLKLVGFYYPGVRGSGYTRFKPKYNVIELLVYTLIEEGDKNNCVSYQVFLRRLWENYGIIVGGLNTGDFNDHDHLIELGYDLDQEDLKTNRQNFLDILKSYGFAKSFHDDLDIVGINVI